jgi:UDP-2,4-diacetamido-2,4,6-trideoxy-beta-L-altropyranose hydrolase
MQAKKLTVLTEGGRVFGFGHITRCLSIGKYFEESGLIVEFIIDGDDSVSSTLESQAFVIMDWLNNRSVLQKLQESAFILIDSLRVTDDQIREIQSLDADIVYIDDEKRRNVLDKGFVLDWTVLSDDKHYFFPKKKGVTYLLGSKYTPLRESFKNANKVFVAKKVQNILISFGGSDVRNLTPVVLETLSKKFPNLKKRIVVGAGFQNIENIKLFQDENTALIYNVNAEKMVSLMQESDIAISSGGQTLYELAYLGLPTIAILLVENAREDTEGWAKVGAINYIGNFDDTDLMKKLVISMELLESQEERQKMQSGGGQFIGFNGGKLIADTIIKEAK